MSLQTYQAALARLLTDRAFRDAFLADPSSACGSYRLDEHEMQSLSEIHRSPMTQHSDLLRYGRVALALKAYPCTARLLGNKVSHIVDAFCAAHPPVWTDEPTLVTEAGRLASFFDHGGLRELGLPDYAQDLIRFEITLFELSRDPQALADAERFETANRALGSAPGGYSGLVPVVGRHVRVESYAYDAPALLGAIENCDRLDYYATPGSFVVLLVKSSDQRRPKLLRINGDAQTLLAACDGSATVGRIVERMTREACERGKPHADMAARVGAALEHLRTRGVLAYRPVAASDQAKAV